MPCVVNPTKGRDVKHGYMCGDRALSVGWGGAASGAMLVVSAGHVHNGRFLMALHLLFTSRVVCFSRG